jgi:type IV pilus assembly protein PilM
MAKLCIGLDIGSGAVKVVQLKQSKRGFQLVNFGFEPVPQQSIVDGSIMNSGAIVDAISTLFSRLRIRQKEVSLAISGHSVIIKKISMPAMTQAELDEQIMFEAENHIPFPKGDVEIDHQVMAKDPVKNQMDVLLVAAKKEIVSDYASLAREARLNPVVVDVAAFCLQNCFEQAYGIPNETIGLLHVGASITTLSVLSAGINAFTRDITIGGLSFTEEIQKQFNVGFDEAEAYKCGGKTGDEVVPQEVDEILNKQADVMAAELQRSFDFFLATTSESQIDRIYLSGGSAQIPALQKAIERRSRMPVELMNPFAQIEVDESRFEEVKSKAPMAAVAVGLALRSEGDS